MKKAIAFVLCLTCITALFAWLPEPAQYDMLVLNSYSFSQDETQASLDSHRVVYESWLTTPGIQSKGLTGLFILDMFEIMDTLENAAEYQVEIVLSLLDELFQTVYFADSSLHFITDDVEDQYDLIDNLYAFMSQGMADSLAAMLNAVPLNFEASVNHTLEHIENTFGKLAVIGDTMGVKFETIVDSGENFSFSIAGVDRWYNEFGIAIYDTFDIAVVYDESFLSVDAAIGHLENAAHQLDIGFGHIFDWSYGNIEYGIDSLILAMQSLQLACQSLNNYSIWSIIDSSWYINDSTELSLTAIEAGFAEAEAMLSGKIYDLDGVDFRPAGIIENLHYGIYRTYIDVYWQADPYAYTFRNILPSGAPADFIDHIKADMVLDPRDSREQMTDYLTSLGTQYMATLFSDPGNVDANVGMGYIGMFAMIRDIIDQAETIVALADGGRIDSLFRNYDWSNLNYTDEIGSIRNYLDHHYAELVINGNRVIYTILIKDPNRSSPGHTVQEGDFLFPVYIVPQVTNGIVRFTYVVEDAVTAVKNGIEYVYTQIDSMIDITLDPNLLDLSDIEEPLDLIYALEASNPDFLAFTPEGKVKFAEFGDSLAVGMQYLADFADTVVATMEYAEALMYEFDMSEADYDSMMAFLYFGNGMMHQMAADLTVPDAYTFINGENINLSAWFDNVPDNMLTVMKNYFEGTDSSMAGLFPDRGVQNNVDKRILPQNFALKGNYPNPFNPLTNIAFDLPSDDRVTLAIFTITGRKVADLIDREIMPAGSYELSWNAAEQASGIYIVRMQYGNTLAYHKMTLLK
ncbi:MAG: T9SS type A sorting domain-containing protein [Candidatus Marinimicrobia bacterium]|nr:T9SS type A sorting domain-containing protein [Candidatus Neomarinimicrobiota bacterium]